LPLESTAVAGGKHTHGGILSRARSAATCAGHLCVVLVEEQASRGKGWDKRAPPFISRTVLQGQYKARVFQPMGEENPGRPLSPTPIAGRICNQFHLGGGGYIPSTVSPCCSSLLGGGPGLLSSGRRRYRCRAVAGGCLILALILFETGSASPGPAGARARGENARLRSPVQRLPSLAKGSGFLSCSCRAHQDALGPRLASLKRPAFRGLGSLFPMWCWAANYMRSGVAWTRTAGLAARLSARGLRRLRPFALF